MEGFVKFITDPDWWGVIATFVAAIVAACITSKFSKRQNELQQQQLRLQEHQNKLQEQQIKLQEHQNKQQEYDLYSRLYECLCSINIFAVTLVYKIHSTISYSNDTKEIRDGFMKLFEEVNDLHNQLNKCSVDVDLKWTEQNKTIIKYYDLVVSTRNLLVFLIKVGNNQKINTCNSIENLNNDDTESLIKFIVKQCDVNIASETNIMLNNYSEEVNTIININILTKIKERCKIE